MAKNKNNKAQNNQYNAEFAEEFNQNNTNTAGKQSNAVQQKPQK
ncbi:hypothetical protein [Paenibacillus harenae]|uniref:Small, acid-soluble spore protein gamma-type n=1 Tax=Paenibacillus harenae TaxID=306543 RepID=A0ABT9U6Y6_PAEHA|nr:hypothetical protein [Paenibacillus harenae]MDQ0060812.1 hypothetical protein [Paenibacillus harenae]MDQ0115401.1 hypothetical protein [Paenibacillus harenae]